MLSSAELKHLKTECQDLICSTVSILPAQIMPNNVSVIPVYFSMSYTHQELLISVLLAGLS